MNLLRNPELQSTGDAPPLAWYRYSPREGLTPRWLSEGELALVFHFFQMAENIPR